jgi:hypothetical protein
VEWQKGLIERVEPRLRRDKCRFRARNNFYLERLSGNEVVVSC